MREEGSIRDGEMAEVTLCDQDAMRQCFVLTNR